MSKLDHLSQYQDKKKSIFLRFFRLICMFEVLACFRPEKIDQYKSTFICFYKLPLSFFPLPPSSVFVICFQTLSFVHSYLSLSAMLLAPLSIFVSCLAILDTPLSIVLFQFQSYFLLVIGEGSASATVFGRNSCLSSALEPKIVPCSGKPKTEDRRLQ